VQEDFPQLTRQAEEVIRRSNGDLTVDNVAFNNVIYDVPEVGRFFTRAESGSYLSNRVVPASEYDAFKAWKESQKEPEPAIPELKRLRLIDLE